jgi:hypothetical protein
MTATRPDAEAPACAEWSRIQHVDPIGTAGVYTGYLLVEWPLPWPRDLGDIPELAPVRDTLAGTGIRLQGLVPASAGSRRVVLYRRPPEAEFVAFRRQERLVALQPVPAADGVTRPGDPGLAGAAVSRAAAQLIGITGAGAEKPFADEPVVEPPFTEPAVTDVLVCTHGRRDRCCGRRGTDLWKDVSASDALGAGARVWRTSHTGGHRFAPTAIVLPQGTAWAYLDRASLARVVAQEGPVGDLLPHYRGCAGMPSPALQALERAVLGEVGWPLLASARSGEELSDGRVRLTVSGAAASVPSVWEAAVGPGRIMPVPDCGAPIDQARKTETELHLTGLSRVA